MIMLKEYYQLCKKKIYTLIDTAIDYIEGQKILYKIRFTKFFSNK